MAENNVETRLARLERKNRRLVVGLIGSSVLAVLALVAALYALIPILVFQLALRRTLSYKSVAHDEPKPKTARAEPPETKAASSPAPEAEAAQDDNLPPSFREGMQLMDAGGHEFDAANATKRTSLRREHETQGYAYYLAGCDKLEQHPLLIPAKDRDMCPNIRAKVSEFPQEIQNEIHLRELRFM